MEANVGWTVGRTIGRGATSTVSLAAATTTGDLFAVKSCPLSRSSLLRREQSILSSLSSRHIISCLGSDVSGGCYHLFLELAAGGALSDYAGYLEESKIRSFTRQIVLGLFYLHSRGVAHGDVKGRNVLVGEDGRRVKLGDFGCARRLGDVGLVMGTPAFMAPEVARGEAQGIESDIWSLGCTVLEMAMGKSPWPEVSDPAAAIHRIGFSAAVPTTPEWMSAEGKDFVSNCLRRDPKERWTTEQLLRHPFVAEADEEPPAPCSNPKQRMWVSPKSSLEFGLWESATEEGKEEELLEIIKQLESPSANWSWDDSWVSVRETTEEGEEGYY
ncbi:hypothetical protein HPP92_024199 [Vanilla planifolia]|uniref:Protein kinase domain-containing protein n=1 Tax=Vanilla planifolia TaxID=51239 RepID=A0A835PLZ0_VANPL|nr:hypothetical protein HPP92_024199 [Vanilla planifolia]